MTDIPVVPLGLWEQDILDIDEISRRWYAKRDAAFYGEDDVMPRIESHTEEVYPRDT